MKKAVITIAILFLMVFSSVSHIMAEDAGKLVAKSDVWSVLQGKWINEDGGEAIINGHDIEYINVLVAPPKDINDPDEKRVISGAIAVKGTLTSYPDKNNKDTIFFKVSGSMMLFDDKGNPVKEVEKYKNDMFFWIQYPDKNGYTIVPCGSENGMEPSLTKGK